MKILNKLISIVLCLVLLSNVTIMVLAEEPSNNTKDLITYRVPVISNEYTEKTVVFYEHEGKYYLDIEDIKNFTRSTISETDSKIVITHGIRELEIDKSTGHLVDSTVYDQGTIPFLVYEGKYLCEGIPMLMYLGAACSIRDEAALEVLMPSITIWESIMPDYLDYYFNITELYGGEDNVKISLICDILSDVLDGVSGHGLFADGDTHLEDALFEILEIDMMKYASVQEAVATKNQYINDFLSSDAVGTLLEGGSNATDTVSEVLDYYADFYLETEILKNNIRWQHSYNVGDIDSASKLSKQINSQVYEQSSIKANLGTYENLSDILDLGMIAFDTAVTSYSLMQYDDDTKNLFAKTINDEMFDYVGYNEISWTNVSDRISNKLSNNEAIIASTAVENLTEYVAGELAEGGTVQALSAFTSKANIYVAATQIATFVSSLINRDLHEAYSADMNAIWLSAVQYDIARLTTQVLLKAGEEEKFSNVASIEKLKDMLALYYRTTIAFSENIAISIDEFGNKNKDEWIKYFSSTTDASVANYAAQYLYRITSCTIVPIVEFSTLDDVVLNSEWIENFESNTTISQLRYEMREELIEFPLSDGTVYYKNTVKYPYFLGDSLVESQINNRYEKIIKEFKSNTTDYDEVYESAKEWSDPNPPYYDNIIAEVTYNRNGAISIKETAVMWSGGMHPYHTVTGITYDIKSGKELKYNDIIIGDELAIDRILLDSLRESLVSSVNNYMLDTLKERTGYSLCEEGLCFYYNVGDAVERKEVIIKYTDENSYLIILGTSSHENTDKDSGNLKGYNNHNNNVVNGARAAVYSNSIFYFNDMLFQSDLNFAYLDYIGVNNGHTLNVSGNYIYFIRSGGQEIAKYNYTAGTYKEEMFCDYSASNLMVYDEYVYFISDELTPDTYSLYRIKTDGTALKCLFSGNCGNFGCFNIYNGILYFTNADDDFCIYKMDLDGSNILKFNNQSSNSIVIQNESLYYTSKNHNNSLSGKVYRMNLDGSNNTIVSDVNAYGINVYGEYIYYTSSNDNYTIHRMKTDGSNDVRLSDVEDCFSGISICNGILFYKATVWVGNTGYPTTFHMYLDGNECPILNDSRK